jgi:PBP1b-binding outer membrane lipoprotein LpoB
MKKLLVFSALLLSGCATVIPVQRHFPDSVPELMQRCPDLKTTPDTTKLSDVVDVVVDNYGAYHECQNKTDKWIDWYTKQKEIFNSVKK